MKIRAVCVLRFDDGDLSRTDCVCPCGALGFGVMTNRENAAHEYGKVEPPWAGVFFHSEI